ncbi:tyrosine-type recombinase/integrase [Streptomyces sp. NBC_00963]|uniref:hypothetical protein n=1 Tax=Streptomyces sp. NBC_00963 TaxID=2903697 RepID=UPI003866696F|nr:tyrosine-type recombinase/integrase [Streptomyces sp. NBC_00963]WSX46772.1 tyrosine-type recombinase/integrase [Streptomyces sp. NBC_00963]
MFFQLIAYGRRCGTLDDLAGTFTRVPVEHVISVEEPNEDFIGKAIPESVIRQLDAHLDTLGTGSTYGCRDIAPDARQLLYRTMYIVLRDTGRRPLEIVSLTRDCLENHNGQPTLIWDNHKRKRHRRRLPITTSTADAIRTWQACRDQLHLPAKGDRFLFPSLTPLSDAPHISSTYLSDALRLWADALPQLHAEGTDSKGQRLIFDQSLIYPYAFRHSYAQRHADAGTPVDVLRELIGSVRDSEQRFDSSSGGTAVTGRREIFTVLSSSSGAVGEVGRLPLPEVQGKGAGYGRRWSVVTAPLPGARPVVRAAAQSREHRHRRRVDAFRNGEHLLTRVVNKASLMDHKSIAMTQRYYTVSLKRKSEAVAKLSTHVLDQHGHPNPSSSTAYEMRTVAVPYGGCTEPSNVKAGGQACPIRFQCAGCGFYRPDPSYLPAIEHHINELRADRETALAMGAAEFVTTALTAQITAYQRVIGRMNTHLASLPASERAQIEEASTVLRKARASHNHTLLPLTPARPKDPR